MVQYLFHKLGDTYMFKFFKSLFSDNTEQVLDMASGVGNFIDESFHTEEEKSAANQKVLELWIKAQQATQGQNKARRLFATMILSVFLFIVLLCVIALTGGYLLGYNPTAYIKDIISLVQALRLGEATMLILGFYYLKGYLGK